MTATEAAVVPVASAPTKCERPLVGVAAVLIGAFIATLNTRITTFGLADIPGGLGPGFAEGPCPTPRFSAGALLWFGLPRQSTDRELLRRTDWGGIVLAGLGFGLIYAALDQGNRLDWLSSGVVSGLLTAGALLVVAFLLNEALVKYPLIHLRV